MNFGIHSPPTSNTPFRFSLERETDSSDNMVLQFEETRDRESDEIPPYAAKATGIHAPPCDGDRVCDLDAIVGGDVRPFCDRNNQPIGGMYGNNGNNNSVRSDMSHGKAINMRRKISQQAQLAADLQRRNDIMRSATAHKYFYSKKTSDNVKYILRKIATTITPDLADTRIVININTIGTAKRNLNTQLALNAIRNKFKQAVTCREWNSYWCQITQFIPSIFPATHYNVPQLQGGITLYSPYITYNHILQARNKMVIEMPSVPHGADVDVLNDHRRKCAQVLFDKLRVFTTDNKDVIIKIVSDHFKGDIDINHFIVLMNNPVIKMTEDALNLVEEEVEKKEKADDFSDSDSDDNVSGGGANTSASVGADGTSILGKVSSWWGWKSQAQPTAAAATTATAAAAATTTAATTTATTHNQNQSNNDPRGLPTSNTNPDAATVPHSATSVHRQFQTIGHPNTEVFLFYTSAKECHNSRKLHSMWCQLKPCCMIMAPGITFTEVDCRDQMPEWMDKYKMTNIPTVVKVSNGKVTHLNFKHNRTISDHQFMNFVVDKYVAKSGGQWSTTVIEPDFVAQKEIRKPEFMLFYATWCPHSKQAKAIWDSVKTPMSSECTFTEFDCSNEHSTELELILKKYNVIGYPTIIRLKDDTTTEFKGQLKCIVDLIQFINKKEEKELIMPSSAAAAAIVPLVDVVHDTINPALESRADNNIILLIYEDDTFRPVFGIEQKYLDVVQKWYTACEIMVEIETTDTVVSKNITAQDLRDVLFRNVQLKFRDEFMGKYIPEVINHALSKKIMSTYESKFYDPEVKVYDKYLDAFNNFDKIRLGVNNTNVSKVVALRPTPFVGVDVVTPWNNSEYKNDITLKVKEPIGETSENSRGAKLGINLAKLGIILPEILQTDIEVSSNTISKKAINYDSSSLKLDTEPLAYNDPSVGNALYPIFAQNCANFDTAYAAGLHGDLLSSSSPPPTLTNVVVLFNTKFLKTLCLTNPSADELYVITNALQEFDFVRLFGLSTDKKEIVKFIHCEFNNISFDSMGEINDKLIIVSQYIDFSVKRNESADSTGAELLTKEESRVKQYLKDNFIINDDINDKIKSSVLCDMITNSGVIKIDKDKIASFSTRLSRYLKDVGLQKKRYNDGFYYYGIVRNSKWGGLNAPPMTTDVKRMRDEEERSWKTNPVHPFYVDPAIEQQVDADAERFTDGNETDQHNGYKIGSAQLAAKLATDAKQIRPVVDTTTPPLQRIWKTNPVRPFYVDPTIERQVI